MTTLDRLELAARKAATAHAAAVVSMRSIADSYRAFGPQWRALAHALASGACRMRASNGGAP